MKKIYVLTVFLISFLSNAQQEPIEVKIQTPLPICKLGESTTLVATYPTIKAATSYIPIPQTYNPGFPFEWNGIAANKLAASADDVWSPVFNLPFNFTFYGVNYNKVLIGSNGVISFDITNAGGTCPWQFTGGIPSTTFPIRNAIFGVYQDTNIASPPVTNPAVQNVNFFVLDTGINAAPNRVFVANWNQLPQFSCNTSVDLQSSQIVLHEGTNAIEFNIKRRECCSAWNPTPSPGIPGGSGIIGTINAAGTSATTPPLRNNSPCWSATDESWAVEANGTTSLPSIINWKKNGILIPSAYNQSSISITPTDLLTATYTAIVEYTKTDGTTFSVEKDITVGVEGPLPVRSPIPVPACTIGTGPYPVNINQDNYMLDTLLASGYNFYYFTDSVAADAFNLASPSYISNPNTYSMPSTSETIYVRIEDTTSGCYNVRSFNVVGAAPAGTFSYPAGPHCNTTVTPVTAVTLGLTVGGVYTYESVPPIPANVLNINSATGEINPLGSDPGNYIVKYDIPASTTCSAFSTTTNITIAPCNCPITLTSPVTCLGTAATVTANPATTTGTYNYIWTVPTGATDPGNVSNFSTSVAGTYTVILTEPSTGCTSTDSIVISFTTPPNAGADGMTTICESDYTPITLSNLIIGQQAGGVWTRDSVNGGTGGSLVGGIFTPAAGTTTSKFLYTVSGTSPCLDDVSVVTINIQSQPFTGSDGAKTVCDSDNTEIDLFGLLGSSPQMGGSWSQVGIPTGGNFDALNGKYTPAVGATTSIFRYTIFGALPCLTAFNDVTITIIPKVDAGNDVTKDYCDDSPTIPLFSLLTGTPQPGGTWTATGTGTGGTFDQINGKYTPTSGVATTRTFEYKVSATNVACADDVSIVTLNINKQPFTGSDGAKTVCDSDNTEIDLFSLLGSSPQTGGSWTQIGIPTGGNFDAPNGKYTPAIGATTSTFRYTIFGVSPCLTQDYSDVVINIIPKADAGIDSSKDVCENDNIQIDLFSQLTGTPQLGGIWSRLSAPTIGFFDQVNGKFTPAIGDLTAIFQYKVTSSNTACSDDLSTVTINIQPLPEANLTVSSSKVCLNSPKPSVTFQGIGGTPPYTFTYSVNSAFPQLITTDSTSDSVTLDVDTNIDGVFRYDLIEVSCSNSSTAPSCSNPQNDFIEVTVLKLPRATIVANTLQACLNDTSPKVTFTGFDGVAPYTFEYKINGVLYTQIVPLNSLVLNVPNSAGTYTYELISVSSSSIPSCSNASTGANQIVNVKIDPLPTLALAFGSNANPLPICINTPITNIVYTIGGSATGATIIGSLPLGLSGVFTPPDKFTISGTPTVSSNLPYNFTVETTGGCLPKAILSGSITVNPSATLVLTSGIGSNNPSVCEDIESINTVFTFGNGATSAYVSSAAGLPSGLTGNTIGNTFVISGTPTVPGNYPFEVSTIGGCPSIPISGIINVKPKVSIVLLSTTDIADGQKICLGLNINEIEYLLGNGATGANLIVNPPTLALTQTYDASTGKLKIKGLTNTLGIFNFRITTIGGCDSASLSGTIEVIKSPTIKLDSFVGTDNQTVCINQPIDNIVYAFNNGAISASIYEGEIPQGISALLDPNDNTKFILSGIPTQSGIFNYKIKTAGGCLPAEISGSIKVIDLPEVALDTEGFICVDVNGNPTTDVEIKTNLSPSQYTFVWSDANGIISPLETGSNYIATKPGLYSVAATNKITTCVGTANTTIVPSLPPAAATAASPSYFAENQLITITVTPIGIYEYQADNGAFQDSNQFYGLPSGRHTITVRDKFSCGSTTVDVRIIDFIKYFTPNGDGYNDVWNITEISDQPNARINIYDRFGKLLKQISPGTNGWDGTINTTNLPADDYWFKVFYKENGEDKEFKSHFSLKR